MTRPHPNGLAARLPMGTFALRPLHPGRDCALLHAWMNDPEVARYWELAVPETSIGAYLRRQVDSTHSIPYVGGLDGVPMSYWELYRADLDPLAEHYEPRPGDAGIHLLLGPAAYRGRGLGAVLLRAVSDWQLRCSTRIVAEPDVDNVRSIRAFERAGFRRTSDIVLPDKHAALMIREAAR